MPMENFQKGPETHNSGSNWSEVYARGSSALDFAKNNWKEIAGVGAIVGTGAVLIASRGSRLDVLGRLVKSTDAGVGEDLAKLAPDTLRRLKGVDHFVFDLDRTLVDHDGALSALTRTMRDELVRHSGLSDDFVTSALMQTTKRLDSPYFWNRLDQIQPLQEKFPGVNLNERFAAVTKASGEAYYAALKAKPETVELLQTLREQGKSVHVFTASSQARALEKLHGSGLIGHVDNVYASGLNAFEDTAASGLHTAQNTTVRVFTLPDRAKGEGTGYQMILDHLATDARRVAMTGDHAVEDVAHAQRLGIFASRARWYKDSPAEKVLPDLELTDPSELAKIVRAIAKGGNQL